MQNVPLGAGIKLYADTGYAGASLQGRGLSRTVSSLGLDVNTSHLTPLSCPGNKVIYILISCQTGPGQLQLGCLVKTGKLQLRYLISGEEQTKLTEFHLDLSSSLNIKYEKFNCYLLL